MMTTMMHDVVCAVFFCAKHRYMLRDYIDATLYKSLAQKVTLDQVRIQKLAICQLSALYSCVICKKDILQFRTCFIKMKRQHHSLDVSLKHNACKLHAWLHSTRKTPALPRSRHDTNAVATRCKDDIHVRLIGIVVCIEPPSSRVHISAPTLRFKQRNQAVFKEGTIPRSTAPKHIHKHITFKRIPELQIVESIFRVRRDADLKNDNTHRGPSTIDMAITIVNDLRRCARLRQCERVVTKQVVPHDRTIDWRLQSVNNRPHLTRR